MLRIAPLLLVAFVAITVYALVLRRRLRPSPMLHTDVREVRARATLVAGEAEDALACAGPDLDYRTAQLGVHATRELRQTLAAVARDRADVLRLLDLIGAGRDDVDDMLAGATDRTESSLHHLRTVRREVNTKARELVDLPGRISAAEQEVADVQRMWAIERDRSARLRNSHPAQGRPATSEDDLSYAQKLLQAASEACADARAREESGDSRGAIAQVEAAEALAAEVAQLLESPH